MSRGVYRCYRTKDETIHHITGNILDKDTWNTLTDTMKAQNIGKLGLCIWAPAGGFSSDFVTDSVLIYNELLRRTFDLMSVTNGVLLTEVPWWVIREHPVAYEKWISEMKSANMTRNHPFCRILHHTGSNGDMLMIEKNPLHRTLPLLDVGLD